MQKATYEFISKQLNDRILEWRKCSQCTEEFPIFQKDQEMLEKIAPTVGGKKQLFATSEFCPDCRARQRLVWRNERNFYSRTSSLSGKKIFSLYSPDAERLNKKPKRELHLRTCDKCATEMISVYPQNADFKVYCEACYNKEVY